MQTRLSHPTEIIHWNDPDDKLPPESVIVMLFTPGWPRKIREGALVDGVWESVIECVRAEFPWSSVVAWAELPKGPMENEREEI
jgi:hypothetical protein